MRVRELLSYLPSSSGQQPPRAMPVAPIAHDPGQFVPVHIHPTQDEFILVQDGMLDLKLDGVWVKANAGDLVRLPRGISHGYFNKSDKPARALFWVSPTQKLEALFNQLHNLTDVAEIVRISAEHEVNFLPPEAND